MPAALTIDPGQKHLFVAAPGPSPSDGRVYVVDIPANVLLAQVFTPASRTSGLAASPQAAPYQQCLLAVSATAGTVTLGDPAPLEPRAARAADGRRIGGARLGRGRTARLVHGPIQRRPGDASSLVAPTVRITATAPGTALVRALYVRGGHLQPYQFEVRLNQNLEPQASVTITKDQYDLVMNVLNWFHPIGVEVRTARLRAHVVELSALNADLFPEYTYPVYRRTGPVLPIEQS